MKNSIIDIDLEDKINDYWPGKVKMKMELNDNGTAEKGKL